jgi:hypothetical protein
MKPAILPISLLSAVAIASSALSAIETATPMTAAAETAAKWPLSVSSADPSVPPAATVTFPSGEDVAAPTF